MNEHITHMDITLPNSIGYEQFVPVKYEIKNAIDECCICLEDVNISDTNMISICCKNKFHTQCYNAWLTTNPSCPICRFKFKYIVANKPHRSSRVHPYMCISRETTKYIIYAFGICIMFTVIFGGFVGVIMYNIIK